MCEWLSRDEWCDARLLCGGRALDAHRAVLASASPFLRRILLSCPIEETPVLIVLPDFDIEALTAVLYYIYNGEVTVPRLKLHKFFDIVKALQIYVDREYLTQLSVDVDLDYNLNKVTKDERFVLRTESDSNSLVTFRKFHHTYNKDITDYKQAPQTRNEHFKSVLGNLQSHGDRQSDYSLRDSFMEYPRNCSGNGRGVPAIPNACYLPTSLLLTNANGQSPNVNLPDASQSLKPSNFLTYEDNMSLIELRRKLSNISESWTGPQAKYTMPVEMPLGNEKRMHLDCELRAYTVRPSIANNQTVKEMPRSSYQEQKSNITSDTSQIKVTILNKALESPWCPRLPNSFRPFRRKGHSLNNCSNDDNNNIQVPPSAAEDERVEGLASIQSSANIMPSIENNKDHITNLAPPEHRNGRYICAECGKTFSQLRNYKYHLSVHRGTREFAASCAVCGKSFNDRGYLSSHMKIHRNRKEYKCSQCPKSFNQRVAYNMHVRIHTGVKPHVCPTCGKAFSRKMLLKQHQRTHSGERPYACPHCEKRFADRSNMTLHLRLHTGVKPFKCPMCPKSFTKKHHLKSHVNFHTGAKPYSCPRCRLAFTQSSNMRTHLKRCTAPDPTDVPSAAT